MAVIYPEHLRKGDPVGIISPSSPVAGFVPRRFNRGISELERMGFHVRSGGSATKRHGHTAGTIEERLFDLHDMFADKSIKCIITTIGGFNCNQLLDAIDYELIAHNPKILMGYSDITALSLAIYTRTGLVTFMGPAILPQFGEYGGLHPYMEASFHRVLCTAAPPGRILPSPTMAGEVLSWDVEDDRPRRAVDNPGPRPLKPGTARGPVIAGNTATLLLLAGTPYWPQLDDAILCIEDDDESNPAMVDRYLTQLRQMGVYSRIAGLIIGRFPPAVVFSQDDSLDDIVLTATRGYDFPVALDFDFGHWDPMMILPNGVRAELSVSSSSVGFSLLDACVC